MSFLGEKQALEKRWWACLLEEVLTHSHLVRGTWSSGERSELEREAWGTWSMGEQPRVQGLSFWSC